MKLVQVGEHYVFERIMANSDGLIVSE